ncbi:two-component sensor histidine kinase [Cohnella xylanilytica]|uniref:histidine kinase n=1 Tax=Cohnella xylanilytica TaxID=557555 RepID=A0A841U2L3_9BACL|nr:HAMP domain-containing sensor histidine kinase [Cohnella xylanilytica]MBB6694977.1 HAMP domain-containing histidine kinase [Cohnella xylanilytica]GIO13790.1 two-component sensor histidine kinase [Cohnella xylanilytica]
MSIRMKLILSYAAMLIVPLVLIAATTLLLAAASNYQYYKMLYFSTAEKFEFDDPFRILKEMKRANERNPGILSDAGYLKEIDAELRAYHSGLVIRGPGGIVYRSDSVEGNADLLAKLPPYERYGLRETTFQTDKGNDMYVVYQYDFTAPAGEPGTVFIASKVDPVVYWVRESFPTLFTVLLVILVLTHSLLTYFVSRSIIRPLKSLRLAAGRIKNGDLDFRVGVEGKNEIGQLGLAFEEMRVQLRHSIEVQLQYEENRKELVSNISHDLKTPITTIKGYVDGVLDGIADSPEKAMRYMKIISAKADEMDRLIDELFLYSKLDLNKLPFDFERVGMRDFLMDWSEEMKFELEKRNVDWSSDIRLGDSVAVLMDRDKFKRVLGNVIGNAVKYMDKEERRIRLGAFEENGRVVLEIEDNGRGIEADALAHIFERFYRAEPSRNSGTGGSGLGLAIAKQIAEGHNGKIEADSEPGIGTTIRLRLPIADREKGRL